VELANARLGNPQVASDVGQTAPAVVALDDHEPLTFGQQVECLAGLDVVARQLDGVSRAPVRVGK
jgi:hypothetical protein